MTKQNKKYELSEVESRLAQGKTIPEIAQELGVNKSGIYARLDAKKKTQQAPQPQAQPQPESEFQKVVGVIKNDVVKIESGFNLDALIPKEDPNYFYRQEDKEAELSSAQFNAVCLIGDASSGKTHLPRQLAAKLKVPYLSIPLDNSVILRELIGQRELKNGQTFFKVGILFELLKAPSVISFEESNALESKNSFLFHELTANRRLFVKDIDEAILLNPQCRIFFTQNPANSKYCGTNKANTAFATRPDVITVPAFTKVQVSKIIDIPKKEEKELLLKYYEEANTLIKASNLRVVFGLRNLSRIAEKVKSGTPLIVALKLSFINSVLLTASEKERDALLDLANVILGSEEYNKTL